MKQIGEILKLATDFLKERGIADPRRSAEELLAAVLGVKRIDLYLRFDQPLEEKELAKMREYLARRAKHEPVEYILGEVEFFGASLKVDRRVLIPRPETEILASLVAKRAGEAKTLWDVCTGSGALGISLKKKFPHLQVTLSDISEEALSLARENAARNGVQVEFLLGDLLTPFKGKTADLIVSNPPYVSGGEYLALDPSVRDFEPKGALLGGESGLVFYERLENLPEFLNAGGMAFLEIGALQGPALQRIFPEGTLLQDWSGKDRFFFLEKQVLSPVSFSSKKNSHV